MTLDRFDAASRLGAEVSYLSIPGEGTGLRFAVHGHYVDPSSGFGGYATLPVTFRHNDESNTAMGNLELGGLWTKQVSPNVGIVVRGGVTLPTSSESDGLQNVTLGYGRLADLVNALPDTTTLRASVSPTFRSGTVFGRVDVGLDLIVDSGWADPERLLRLQPGLGFMFGDLALMGELVMLHAEGDTISNFAVSGRLAAGSAQPYLGLVIPLDETIQSIMDLAVTAGIEGRM